MSMAPPLQFLFFFLLSNGKKKKLEFSSEKLCYNYLYNLLQMHTSLSLTPTISDSAQMAVNRYRYYNNYWSHYLTA